MCFTCWKRHRYNTDDIAKEKMIASSKRYRDSHPGIVSAQAEARYRNDTCNILIDHADEHKEDDNRLTTDFIADQLEKFKDKIYDEDDLKLLNRKS